MVDIKAIALNGWRLFCFKGTDPLLFQTKWIVFHEDVSHISLKLQTLFEPFRSFS